MKDFKLENQKIPDGFKIPQSYFDDLHSRILSEIDHEVQLVPEKPRNQKWYFSAAAALLIGGVFAVYQFSQKPVETDMISIENYLTYESEISDDYLISLMDELDIEQIEIDINIKDSELEDVLSSNPNLEQYIIN